MKKIILFFISGFFLACNFCFSQTDSISKYSKFSKGDIIVSSDLTPNADNINVSNKPYDEYIIGVFREMLKMKEGIDNRVKYNPVLLKGIAEVKYNSENGLIKKGDAITTSSEAGVGMKATKTGMIVGIALEDATAPSGLLKIRICVQYVVQ